MWSDSVEGSNEPSHFTLAKSTEFMDPLPRIPNHELYNRDAVSTILNNHSLFDIVTPINIDKFLTFLGPHPNRPLVDSVSLSLRVGCWPWAETKHVNVPRIIDAKDSPLEDGHREFVMEQRAEEIRAGRFSQPFPYLFPGMHAVPYVIAEKDGKLRFCVNHSAEPHSRNSLIDKADASVPLDNLQDLGKILRRVRSEHGPHVRLVVFKSDVAKAYRRIPMHPLWQIKQVVKVDGEYCVDRNNNFGNRAAGRLWGIVFGLVLWVATYVLLITDLLCYVDDTFSWDFEGNLDTYTGYDQGPVLLPRKQARLLRFWDQVGIPHDQKKQVYGLTLTIIGFSVDPNAMTISLPLDKLQELIAAIRDFIHPSSTRRPLIEFQRLAGWINWGLNVEPLLRPGLSMMYEKMSGKRFPKSPVTINNTIRFELDWIARHLEASTGVHMMDSIDWPPSSADQTIYTDASLNHAMAFWVQHHNLGYRYHIDQAQGRTYGIFYWEAYAVVSAIFWAATSAIPTPSKLLVYTDNMNTVDLFDRLRASSKYNPLLIATIDVLISRQISLRVAHVPGEQNIIADAISRSQAHENHIAIGDFVIPISYFQPPPLRMGPAL
jgi:hypothetical protein